MAEVYRITLEDGVSKAAGKGAANVLRLELALKKAGHTSETAGKQFSYALNALSIKLADVAFNIGGKFVDSMLEIGDSLHHTAGLASRTKLSFANLFGGIAEGAAVTKSAIELAKKYGFSIEAVIGNVSRFAGAGFSLPQIETLLGMGGDLRSLGRTEEQINRLFEAMTKIKNSGKLEGDEIQVLSENGVNVEKLYESLAAKLGKTKDEVIALKKAGKIPAAMALNSIGEAILLSLHKTKVGAAGAEAANETIEGIEGRIRAELGSRVFNAVSAAEPALVKGMQAIFSGLNGAGTIDFEGGLTKTIQGIGALLERIGPMMPAIADNFVKAFGSVSGLKVEGLNGLVDRLPELATGLGNLLGNLVKIAEVMGKIAGNVLAAPANEHQSSLPGASLGFDNKQGIGKLLATRPGALLDIVGNFWGDFFKAGKNLSEGMAGGIKEGAPTIGAAAASVAQGAIDSIAKTTDSHSPSRVAFTQGAQYVEGYALGLEEQAQLAASSSRLMAEDVVAASGGGASVQHAAAASSIGLAAGGAASAGGGASMGDVHVSITVSGADSPGETAEAVKNMFELELANVFGRHLESVGA